MQELYRKVNIDRIVQHIEQLSRCSSTTCGVTRLSFTKESKLAYELVSEWMEDAGMFVRRDEVNNLIGRYEGTQFDAPVLIIGSHLDSVIEGGKYDGSLGVIAGIEVVKILFENNIRLKHPIEVIGFCDEEGARFHSTFLGSKAVSGVLQDKDLQAKDVCGKSIAESLSEIGLTPANYKLAARNPKTIQGYIELHIEQGPILEEFGQACGVVSGIAGASRYEFSVKGSANHAGTVPMNMRKDALAGAAEMVLAIEKIALLQNEFLVATVGKLSAQPGASNVIPGLVEGTLDIRSIREESKLLALKKIIKECKSICKHRGLICEFNNIMETPVTTCSSHYINVIESVLVNHGIKPIQIVSGAGHDAMVIANITEIGMIFVRCKNGLSHSPDEYVTPDDMKTGVSILLEVVLKLAS